MNPKSVEIVTKDHYRLAATVWRRDEQDGKGPVAVIAPATSVMAKYYARFAAYLFTNGYNVITFDYRGIGGSRHGSLRKLHAGWLDWATDFDAVLAYASSQFPDQPLDVVGHSIGGFLVGLCPSAGRIRRIFTVGAQYAYWRDYAAGHRLSMFFRWHVFMPLVVSIFRYMPAKRLGWMEDTPHGVALEWSGMGPRFEHSLSKSCARWARDQVRAVLVHRFTSVKAPILAIGLDDDPFGTKSAVERGLAYYTASERTHLRIAPQDIGVPAIGHFSFFNQRFQDALWPTALAWLREQKVRTMGATDETQTLSNYCTSE